MKIKTMSFSLLLALSLTAAGCSGKGDSPSPGADGAPKGDAKPISFKVMDWQGQNPPYEAAYEDAIKTYMKLHPNVKIERIYQPNANNGYEKLLDTQFVSHNAPDAIQLDGNMIKKYTNQEYIMPLDSYMQQPTPYSGGKKWIETFVGGEESFLTAKTENRLGAISFVPVDGGPGLMENRPFFYNKDLLAKAGVTDIPTTWKQFIEACKKLKAAGITPVAADNNRFLNWIQNWTGNQFGENAASAFFDSKYDGIQELYGPKRSIAVFTGKIDRNDGIVQAQTDLIKEFSQYWQDGWAGANEQAAQQLFLYQKAAFLLDGNWNYGHYKNNIKDFQWSVMPFPMITKETSPLAEEAFPKGATAITIYGWGLNKDLEKDPEKLKAVLDYFQYVTSKEAQERFVDIAVTNSPVAGVKVPEAMKPFMETDKNRLKVPIGNALYLEADPTVRTAAAQQFLTGKIDKNEYLKTLADSAAQKLDKKVRDQLDDKIGIPSTIAAVQKQIDELKASGAPELLVKVKQKSLETLNQQLELYRTYAKPALK
ncbi:ABC transporter substrate-binding protein [Paenibacillus flagellatus]|uniref:ABC transporter substrate-binding protein n=1 Tax=Paenibacillus flagellatus TaxID=2211139 RepID=A0A2V5KVE1_9BACL|nr:extracellular solute-binding protein [Paenibacillus flagellatus]PYI53496.1 hypothetical protein DLM86_17155 [Paenibacillus flagellatus]